MMVLRLAPLPPSRPDTLVLAVSGGRDSMVLLDAMTGVAGPEVRTVVASFDHGTGKVARKAVELVREAARDRDLVFVSGVAALDVTGVASEAAWRAARWTFLRSVASRYTGDKSGSAVICTAHNRNDQVETVLMRAMRDAGARGLAGLAAPSLVFRPLINCWRDDIASYAHERGIRWVEDPSNRSTRYLRNRLRHEVLPRLEMVRPGIQQELVDVGERAAAWRRDVDALIERAVAMRPHSRGLDVSHADLAAYPADSIALLWAAVAARAGLVADRRGAARIADFILHGRSGGEIQLSGDWRLTRSHDWLELRRPPRRNETRTNPRPFVGVSPSREGEGLSMRLDPTRVTNWRLGPGCWSFSVDASAASDAGAWSATLSDSGSDGLIVRAWRPGDRMRVAGAGSPQKVKRLLTDAGVTGERRAAWPVVLEGDRIVWIPGVCRADAATERSGRPALAFVCAYLDR